MEVAIATLTVKDAGDSEERRKELAAWLRYQAASLLKDGHKYSKRFRARYFIETAE